MPVRGDVLLNSIRATTKIATTRATAIGDRVAAKLINAVVVVFPPIAHKIYISPIRARAPLIQRKVAVAEAD